MESVKSVQMHLTTTTDVFIASGDVKMDKLDTVEVQLQNANKGIALTLSFEVSFVPNSKL